MVMAMLTIRSGVPMSRASMRRPLVLLLSAFDGDSTAAATAPKTEEVSFCHLTR
jgi:hypothetical protein